MTYLEVKALNPIETEPCTRCGGSGQYSFCTMYGSKCFKCAGAGKRYTKRGRTAKAYLMSLRLKETPVTDIKVGDEIRQNGKAYIVTEITESTHAGMFSNSETNHVLTPYSHDYINLHTLKAVHGIRKESTVSQHSGIDDIKSWLMMAEFQKSLLKSGKPSKTTSPECKAWYEAAILANK